MDGARLVCRAAPAEGRAAPTDSVDLVDEDDALAAPLARDALRLPREPADDDGVHADERLSEPGPWDRDERGVEARRNRLGQHRLPRARRAEEEQPSFSLAAGAFKRLARLPERNDPPHLLLRLRLAAHVLEPDTPVGITGLVSTDLRDTHEQERTEEDEEVEDQ